LNQSVINVFWYKMLNAAVNTPTQVGQVFWDYYKTFFRQWQTATANHTNLQINVTGMNVNGDYGSYLIPVAEAQGLRAVGASEYMPSYVAGTVKLGVGSRTTRPGSKRIAGLLETDVAQNLLATATATLLTNLAAAMDDNITGGSPPFRIDPVIVKRKEPMVPPFEWQIVLSAQASTLVKSQVSRRLGKGN